MKIESPPLTYIAILIDTLQTNLSNGVRHDLVVFESKEKNEGKHKY